MDFGVNGSLPSKVEDELNIPSLEIDSTLILDDAEDSSTTENVTKSNIFKDLRKFADEIAKEIKNDPNHGYLLLSVVIVITWAIYIILYNSRVQGLILTAVLRRFIKKGEISIGSFSISLLWGKLMFREIVYVTEDYGLRVVDAIVQFHYWLPYIKKEITEDMSKCDHRLWVELNGPELHIYNRSKLYGRLEELFGLEPKLIPETTENKVIPGDISKHMGFWKAWRDLLPVIKVDLNMARFVFGNRLIPSTLLLTMDKAECFYSTKPAASPVDFFMHVVKSRAENFRVILAPSPKYTGILDEPPRFMGEGFVVMSSSKIQFYYYMDEAGIVSLPCENLLIQSGDDFPAPPVWGLDIKCEKGTNLSYGPWADRQREQLFKFFFPQDYQKMEITTQIPGTVRQAAQFDVRLSILTEATIDILFTKEKETNAVHMTCQKGSYFEMTLPWIVKKEGYIIRINGQFLYLDASTSLLYRSLFEAESFKYDINVKYPLMWNCHQNWEMIFHGSKVTVHFLYVHKEFFRDLLDDWSSKAQPDILHFIPYTWHFSFNFKLFELVTLANEHNWLDCSSQHQANAHVAFCGDVVDLRFSLPTVNFLPVVVPLKFIVLGRVLFLSIYLPPAITTSTVLAALDENAKYYDDSKKLFAAPVWRKFCKLNAGWIDCWQVPEVKLTLGYTYHPIPPVGPSPQANVSTPEKVEILLSPIRAPNRRKSHKKANAKKSSPKDFDPNSLASDVFVVDLQIVHPSDIKLYGSILRNFINLKENIFGENQKFIDMSEPNSFERFEASSKNLEASKHSTSEEEEFDERKYRPFEVTVNINIRNVRGHLIKDCFEVDPPCPTINLDHLVFEMNKKYRETQMQVVISPLILNTYDKNLRTAMQSHLQHGFMVLSGFQMRGHAMFSDKGRSLWEETLEYAWLVELTVGSLSGKLTAPQLEHVITGLETFIFTAVDNENCLRNPRPYNLCYHGDPQPDCSHTLPDHYCPTVDIIKYRMLRTSIDAIDLHLIEAGTDLNLQVFPIRIATCNLHGQHTRSGITAHIENVRLRNYVCAWINSQGSSHINEIDGKAPEGASSGGYSGRACTPNAMGTSSMTVGSSSGNDTWVEAAAVVLGPLYIDAAISSNILHHDMQLIQHKFLKNHDSLVKRLWFLWPQDATNVSSQIFGKCGCVGGCNFLGVNRNGPRFFKPSQQDFVDGLNIAQLRINEKDSSPGYGQSILEKDQLVFRHYIYSNFTHGPYGSTLNTNMEQLNLSSGYTKNISPALPHELHDSRSNSLHQAFDTSTDSGKQYLKASSIQQRSSSSKTNQDSDTLYDTSILNSSLHSHDISYPVQIRESSSLGRPIKDPSTVTVQGGECLTSPGSLSDLRVPNSRTNHFTGKSSLSLQTEIRPVKQKFSLNGFTDDESTYIPSAESPSDSLEIFCRTVSVGSEVLSEAFYSADEEQMHALSKIGKGVSHASSQASLPTAAGESCNHNQVSGQLGSSSSTSPPSGQLKGKPFSPTKGRSKIEQYLESGSRSRSNSSDSNSSRSSKSSENSASAPPDFGKGNFDQSQTSLLHSDDSDEIDEIKFEPQIKTKLPPSRKRACDEFSSEGGSISGNSFISAMSSQEDLALVNLHMQLYKPITESPLLMSSYINHMTQLRCSNWDTPTPTFQMDKNSGSNTHQSRRMIPYFEKLTEGFTAIRMVEGSSYSAPPRSPIPVLSNTPSHPYSWDTPVFVWGEAADSTTGTAQEEVEVGVGSSLCDSNTTRTTVVMKVKKDIDLSISPIGLESAQRFLDALTPILASLHPLTIVNRAHFKSVRSVESKNKLKKDRYMYWSKLRDGKKSGTPEQGPVVTSTYVESCFQQIQGQFTIPRVNVTLLQASVVEEIISFSALDNIKDLTCVSLFSFCLDGVNLHFYSGHQSKQSVQIYMRNPKVSGKPKKSKSKTKQTVDLLTEPVYIETSERQQEENMISVSINKLHIQLRRLKNESSLLKDASITAIPNHRSKVMFTFRRCSQEDDVTEDLLGDGVENLSLVSPPYSAEEKMGFIILEAGLENVALKAVKRKGFGCHTEQNDRIDRSSGSTSHATVAGRRDSTDPGQNPSSSSSAPNATQSKGPLKPSSGAVLFKGIKKEGEKVNQEANIGTSMTASERRGSLDNKEDPVDTNDTQQESGSQTSNATAHSGIPAGSTSSEKKDNKEETTPAATHSLTRSDKKDITSFVTELSTVWFNFAAPPQTPITKKIDYTRLDWNLLSTASPSINAWMNPSDRLTVSVIQFLHASESRRLGVMASLMAEALDVPSIHVPPKNKYSKLMPLSQAIQEDPSCQLCNVLRRYVLQISLDHIESNLMSGYLPKLATLRQGVVVLSRQWKSALYMPLLMEQTFRYKQARSSYKCRSVSRVELPPAAKVEDLKVVEERESLLQHEKESPLSNREELAETKEGASTRSDGERTDGIVSSASSHLPPRQALPSFPPRSSTASAILPSGKFTQESPTRKFVFPKFGMMLEETLNFFRNQATEGQTTAKDNTLPASAPTGFPIERVSKDGSHSSLYREKCSVVNSANEPSVLEPPLLPSEDLYKWMAKQQEHNLHSSHNARPTVTFNKGIDLPTVTEGIEVEEKAESGDIVTDLPSKTQAPLFFQEPQPAHFLEAHVIFEPLLSAIGVVTQQVTGGALEQLGENVSVTASVETLRIDIIESEAAKQSRKKRKPGVHSGNCSSGSSGDEVDVSGKFYLDITGDLPAFICEKIGLEIDISKVADESRGWVCQQPTLFVSRRALKQHTSTMVHFSLNVSYIAQQVNMPLLRLLHQIFSMYQNALQTQIGLKEQRPSESKSRSDLPPALKESLSEIPDRVIKGAESSLDLSKDQEVIPLVENVKEVSTPFSLLSPTSSARPSSSIPRGPSNRIGRPQSFAQKLRSSSKMSKGYKNLKLEKEQGAHSPLLGISIDGGSDVEANSPSSDKSPIPLTHIQHPATPPAVPATPKCWRNIYYLVDLYATTPETKTVQQRTGVGNEITDNYKSALKDEQLKYSKDVDVERGFPATGPAQETSILTDKIKDYGYFGFERTPLVIFGLAKIQKTKLLATLSGLKLEAEMNAMHSSITFREQIKGVGVSRSTSELSLTGHIGSTMIILLEGIAPSQQTVVRVTISKSQGLYSSLSHKTKDRNSVFITIGPVQIDIPQHPIILHDMMTRGTKQLSSTLQELRVSRPSRLIRGTTIDETDVAPSPKPTHIKSPEPVTVLTGYDSLLHPLAIQFSILLQEMSIHAALLPSLQATYCMQQVSSIGITGAKAKFNIHLPCQHLAFSTRIQDTSIDSTLPPSAKIGLPQVRVEAEYIQDSTTRDEQNSCEQMINSVSGISMVDGIPVIGQTNYCHCAASIFPDDGMVLREGNYLNSVAEIGALELSLTTDLLNHLVFVQKVFMKEVNEVVQKMAGSDKLVPLWLEEGGSGVSALQRLLFAIQIKLKGIIITATTPTQSAVRLETGTLELDLSNRVQNVSKPSTSKSHNAQNPKIFGKAQVDVTLALGQLIRNELFDEVEPELQQLAYFRTRISLRNAFHHELSSVGEEVEMVLITLTRPLICIQPLAVDRAVLVWLNYKNAYEYWNEQRATLNKEVLTATQRVFEKVGPQLTSLSAASNIKNNLFLQLTVSDIGVCLPLNPCRSISHQVDTTETKDALVVTLDNTIISACNSGSLVCKAQFQKFCTRFAPEFETSLDDWKPDLRDSAIINLCMVSEGTYEICTRTTVQNQEKGENAKWLLNVQWQMEGVELHLDVNIGKHLSSLARTLTMLTGVPDIGDVPSAEFDSETDDNLDHIPQDAVALPDFIFNPNIGTKQRAKLLEIEMNEQAKTVHDLQTLGASAATIESEMKRLKELEQIVSNDFRRDVLMRIRRQSIKATSMKDRLGLGHKLQHLRSKSFKIPSPTIEIKEPTRLSSVTSWSTDSNPPPIEDEIDIGDVFANTLPEVSFQLPNRSASEHEMDAITQSDSSTEGALRLRLPSDTSRNRLGGSPHGFAYSPGMPTGGQTAGGFKQTDPSIDLELDVKVSINSGECILYNKDFSKEDEGKGKLKKERSFSSGIHDLPSSPGFVRKKSDSRNLSSAKMKHGTQTMPHSTIELTAFFIPGLDVKVHYESHNINEDTPGSVGKGSALGHSPGFITPRSPRYHFPPPRSPRLIQTKLSDGFTRPIDAGDSPNSEETETESSGRPTSFPSLIGATAIGPMKKRASLFTWLTLQSIPAETIISPSILDFMEKVLEPISLPEPSKTELSSPVSIEPEMVYNLDMDSTGMAGGGYSYASFPVDVIVYFHMQPSAIRFSCQPVSRVECLLKLPSLNVVFSSKRAEELDLEEGCKFPPLATGGLSVTGALEDFSLFVFHPYGGKHRGIAYSDSERKDSLSVMVEFVKFHIVRSRKIHFRQDSINPKLKISLNQDGSNTIIRFSAIVDIGTALFKYDMRRLQEILAFPRAWYRRTIVRRLFLGDMASTSTVREADVGAPIDLSAQGKRHSTSSFDAHIGSASTPSAMTSSWKRERKRLNSIDSDINLHGNATSGSNEISGKLGSWETLVQFAVNFTKLDVHMNMGNVMGNAVWTTKDFKANGRLSIGSCGHKNLYISLGLGGSCMEAKGGIVGGIIELADINMYLKIREDPCTDPDHVIGIKFFALQSRLDYMGTSVLMGRVSSLYVTLKDDWKLTQCSKDGDQDATKRGATIFILGDLEWDQLQLLISKSTTADLLKMIHKLEEFFTAQFKSSKRVFSSLQSIKSKPSIKLKHRRLGNGFPANQDGRHHRHWHRVLNKVSGMTLTTLPDPLPLSGTVLGGSLELHGTTIFLACFHGINFRSKSWALFSLKQPYINFTSEVQEVSEGVSRDVHIVQNLAFSLGLMEQTYAQHVSMAKVCRITRNMVFPPQCRTIQEWFLYAFCTSDLDDVDRFPTLDGSKTEGLNSSSPSETKRSSKLRDHNHSSETIFALPSLEIHLNTKHMQATDSPGITDRKPVVECSLVTEFQDHIFVTIDAENFFFLHDLINSYVKDTRNKMSGDADLKEGEKKSKLTKVNEPTQLLQQDWREFTCTTWHLEPTVRLLSWATRNLEPYGVDYILNKLGFSHARTTIPKWLQRGCMDPLDKILSILIYRMISAIHDHDAASR